MPYSSRSHIVGASEKHPPAASRRGDVLFRSIRGEENLLALLAAGMMVKRGRVLVIEDDPGHQRLLAQILELAGYAVTAVDTALGAAALVQRLRPRVVLLDLGLPLRSGAALLAELKDDPRTAAVPVVVVSAMHEMLPPERRGQADAVVAKPFSPRALLDAVAAVQSPRPVTELDPG